MLISGVWREKKEGRILLDRDIVKSGVRQEIKRRPAVGLTRYCHRLDSHL
jgi:hypothetical protein